MLVHNIVRPQLTVVCVFVSWQFHYRIDEVFNPIKKMYGLLDHRVMSPLQRPYCERSPTTQLNNSCILDLRPTYLFNITYSTVFATHSRCLRTLEVGTTILTETVVLSKWGPLSHALY